MSDDDLPERGQDELTGWRKAVYCFFWLLFWFLYFGVLLWAGAYAPPGTYK